MIRLIDRINMAIVVDWDVKPQIKQANKETENWLALCVFNEHTLRTNQEGLNQVLKMFSLVKVCLISINELFESCL